MRAAIYSRVSTDRQTTDNQNIQLTEVAEKMGWSVDAIYSDVISGSTENRPQLDEMMLSVMRKDVDVVMAWSVDRLGRSLQHLVALLSDLHSKDVNLYLHQQGIDTTTPTGRMMFQMMGVFAEFEKEMIRNRVCAGLDRARKQGKRLGRPTVPPIKVRKVKQLREEQLSVRKIAHRTGLSVGKVHQIVSQP